MSILRWLGLESDSEPAAVDSLGEIEKALTGLEPGQARYVAGFAYILGRVARADHEVSDAESTLMAKLVSEHGQLPDDYFTSYVRHIQDVSGADVQRVAQKYIAPARLAVVVVGDRKAIEAGIRALDLGPVTVLSIDEVIGS